MEGVFLEDQRILAGGRWALQGSVESRIALAFIGIYSHNKDLVGDTWAGCFYIKGASQHGARASALGNTAAAGVQRLSREKVALIAFSPCFRKTASCSWCKHWHEEPPYFTQADTHVCVCVMICECVGADMLYHLQPCHNLRKMSRTAERKRKHCLIQKCTSVLKIRTDRE